VEDAGRGHVRKAWNHCAGSVGKAADVLRISGKTLWEKMKRLEIGAYAMSGRPAIFKLLV